MQTSLKNRQERVNLLYTYYLSDWKWEDLARTTDKLSQSELETVKETIENIDRLEKEILKFLKAGWSWERIGVLEKAILINGAAEILLFNNKEKIVISESNKIAKKYIGEDKPVKLITAILNQIKKEA